MEKIGHQLDAKLQNIEVALKSPQEGGVEGGLKKVDLETADKVKKTFARFEEFLLDSSVPQVSTRQRMLIMNMLDNRNSGWEKTKRLEDSGPMKVEELRQQQHKKLMEEAKIREEAER
jgi:hypothetical protein